jgi:hypothetical protein
MAGTVEAGRRNSRYCGRVRGSAPVPALALAHESGKGQERQLQGDGAEEQREGWIAQSGRSGRSRRSRTAGSRMAGGACDFSRTREGTRIRRGPVGSAGGQRRDSSGGRTHRRPTGGRGGKVPAAPVSPRQNHKGLASAQPQCVPRYRSHGPRDGGEVGISPRRPSLAKEWPMRHDWDPDLTPRPLPGVRLAL